MPDKPVPLSYESPIHLQMSHTRPKWVYAVVGLYILLVIGFAAIVLLPGFLERGVFLSLSITLSTLLLCEVGLLMVPVRLSSRRPLTRTSLWIPLLASGLLGALLVAGAGLALGELFYPNEAGTIAWTVIPLSVSVWMGWAFIFWFISRTRTPDSIAEKLHRYLLAGSVLELLVAVPAHVIVRRRTECCAGVLTGLGICAGLAVMLLAFGPSVGFLYYRKWKQIQN
jgi:hypothetical protein